MIKPTRRPRSEQERQAISDALRARIDALPAAEKALRAKARQEALARLAAAERRHALH
jgi:hypothetical protein